MTEIEGPLHVAVLVTELSKAEAFYGGVLGLKKAVRPMEFPGVWYQVGTFQIHLIVASGQQTSLPNAEKWGRNPHMAFAVSSLEAVKARLLAADCPIQMSASGRTALFAQDPDGNVIELSQA
ncbi:MAG TPA: VOC family protein [Trichocoleus sp.]